MSRMVKIEDTFYSLVFFVALVSVIVLFIGWKLGVLFAAPQPSVYSEGPEPGYFWVFLSESDGRSRELVVKIRAKDFDAEVGDLTVFVEGEEYCNWPEFYEDGELQRVTCGSLIKEFYLIDQDEVWIRTQDHGDFPCEYVTFDQELLTVFFVCDPLEKE